MLLVYGLNGRGHIPASLSSQLAQSDVHPALRPPQPLRPGKRVGTMLARKGDGDDADARPQARSDGRAASIATDIDSLRFVPTYPAESRLWLIARAPPSDFVSLWADTVVKRTQLMAFTTVLSVTPRLFAMVTADMPRFCNRVASTAMR